MKKGGCFFDVFLPMCKCSHPLLGARATMALNDKELHKKYSTKDYCGMDYPV